MKLANLAGHVNSLDNTLASVFQGRCGRWLLPLAKMREFEKFRKNQKVVRTCRARLARLSGPQETQNARGWEYSFYALCLEAFKGACFWNAHSLQVIGLIKDFIWTEVL